MRPNLGKCDQISESATKFDRNSKSATKSDRSLKSAAKSTKSKFRGKSLVKDLTTDDGKVFCAECGLKTRSNDLDRHYRRKDHKHLTPGNLTNETPEPRNPCKQWRKSNFDQKTEKVPEIDQSNMMISQCDLNSEDRDESSEELAFDKSLHYKAG